MRSMGFGDCGGHESGLQQPIQLRFQVVRQWLRLLSCGVWHTTQPSRSVPPFLINVLPPSSRVDEIVHFSQTTWYHISGYSKIHGHFSCSSRIL